MNTKNRYIVYNVSDELFFSDVGPHVEYLDSKLKGWLTYKFKGKAARILFKQGEARSGGSWSEKVTCELAELLDLPHASYELAYLSKDDPCVISLNFLEEGDELKLGNELIEGFDKDQRFKNTKHTLDAMLNAMQQNKVQLPMNILERDHIVTQASDLLIGYLCFDAWIGNTDRNAENWGVIIKSNNTNVLAPTFDHASSLGRNESDEKRMEKLKTKDSGCNVQKYVRGAMVPIYDNDGNQLNTISLIKECRKYNQQVTDFWIEEIIKIMNQDQRIKEILNLMPEDFISEPAKKFAIAFLKESTEQLRGLKMTKQIYLAWQEQSNKRWHVIGQLLHNNKEYEFRYTNGVKSIPSFSVLPNMPEHDKVYRSPSLFSLFKNRLMPKSRPEYHDYMGWLGFNGENSTTNDLDVLAISGGERETDFFRIIPVPAINSVGDYSFKFFVDGLNLLDFNSKKRVLGLKKGDRLYLNHDFQNKVDRLALLLRTDDPPCLVGYTPGYFTKVIHQIKNENDDLLETIRINVLQVNKDAPIQMRLLCELSSPLLNKAWEEYEDEFKLVSL